MRVDAKICLTLALMLVIGGCAAATAEDSDADPSGSADRLLTSGFAKAALPTYEDLVAYGSTAKVHVAADGELVVDATAGRVILDVPATPRDFASPEDLASFASAALGGKPVRDAKGKLVGVSGAARAAGQAFVLDHAARTARLVTDPIAALLGGASGSLRVAGRLVCVTAACAAQQGQASMAPRTRALASRTQCSADGSLCVSGGTGRTDLLNYHNWHSWTDVGGRPFWCWFGIGCPAGADLGVATAYVKTTGDRWGAHATSATNVTHVDQMRWAIDWWIFGTSGEADVLRTSGVCARHTARRGNASVPTFVTSEGDTRGPCP